VKAILYYESNLAKEVTIEELNTFIKEDIYKIMDLFNPTNLESTIRKLSDYEAMRVKQLFPSVDK
jgi:hypothetical protein